VGDGGSPVGDLSRTEFGAGTRWLTCILLLIAILAQSGGMFLHMAVRPARYLGRGELDLYRWWEPLPRELLLGALKRVAI